MVPSIGALFSSSFTIEILATSAEMINCETGSYYYRTLPCSLFRRGLSRGGGQETYREPLEDDNDFIPQNFRDSIYDAIEQYGSESGRSSPITAPLEASNTNWTANFTGNTTDRSSSYSTVTCDVW